MSDAGETSPTLAEFLADDDPNKWWRLASGDHENLFDEAMEERDQLRDALVKLRFVIFTPDADGHGPMPSDMSWARDLIDKTLRLEPKPKAWQ